VQVDATNIVVYAILPQLGEGNIDHPHYYVNKKLNKVEMNYLMIEREGLGMTFSLYQF
jgi:hypothetical protein